MKKLHALPSEQSVIGALLQDPRCAERIADLNPEHFYDAGHRLIFTQILSMLADKKPIDAVTVAEALDETGQGELTGGLAYLGEMAINTPGSANVEAYAKSVRARAQERLLVAAAEAIYAIAQSQIPLPEKLSKAQQTVMSITEATLVKTPRPMREIMPGMMDTIQARAEGKEQCLSTGFIGLDQKLNGGFRPGNLILVAGRPGMGKTALAANMALFAAQKGASTLFLSMEMNTQELTDRLIAQAANIPLQAILTGALTKTHVEQLQSAIERFKSLPLTIDEAGAQNHREVASIARSVKRKEGLDLLVVDYLQLMEGEGESRNQALESITRGLKALAKELMIPVIALSQLSRKCEERQNKRPILSDLRESGALEQDADIILFVYRDEIYRRHTPDLGTGEIIIGKNRQGQTGMERLGYEGQYTRFTELASNWQARSITSAAPHIRRGLDN